jgi:hypothetical protein
MLRKKVIDFFDRVSLQFFESKRFLFDEAIPHNWETLSGAPPYRQIKFRIHPMRRPLSLALRLLSPAALR